MDDRRARAWRALDVGPAWRLRDAPDDEPVSDERVAAGDVVPRDDGSTAMAESAASAASAEVAVAAAFIEATARRAGVEGRAPDGSDEPDAPAESVGDDDDGAEHDPHDAGDAGSSTALERAVALVASPVESARRDPVIARLPWPALADAVSGCTACALCKGRRNTVFGVGPQPASWMLVGEAPGEQEDERGEPFVGPAGRLLDQMLASIGVDRPRDAFIANVLKCRPPGNRNPQPEEVARCEPYLLRQVELLQPRLIVVLGRFAAQSLLRTDATIASLRGRVHRYRAGDRDVPMVVTYHPAYLLRNLPDKAKAWADLRLARRAWESAPPSDGQAG